MITKFKNLKRMRNFISEEAEQINNEDFNEWLEYLKEYSEFIEEEIENGGKITEGASLTLSIQDTDYEMTVNFIRTIENGELVYLVDLDYDQEIEEL